MGPQERDFWRDQIPLGRMGSEDDVGRVVAFLLSDDAAYVAGADLLIDDGLISSVKM